MKRLYKFSFIIWTVVILLVFGSCSTKKNTWTRRNFHNITAHYNAYFNGQMAIEDARKSIASEHKDNYSEILDVFPLGTDDGVKNAALNLDRAIKKASIVIHQHSMVFNGSEKVKWVYYSYMMMGISRFYGHDYGLAKQTFKYVASKYDKEIVKFDALLWIARVQVIQGDYDEARGNLGNIQNKMQQGMVSDEVKRLFPMVYADLYLKQKNYEAAIPYLNQSINSNKRKSDKARLYFILGQVQQKRLQFYDAIASYQKVLKNNAAYEMDFNARINMAKCYDGTNGNAKDIVNQLLKMLKDEKNKDYLDQLYFALAEVELKNKNIPKAIEYLKLSVEKSTTNNLQKAFSSLKLADIYFDKPEYQKAQAYYDSTILFLPKTYTDYAMLKERKDVLTELVTNLLVVEREDSLQALAAMSDSKRNNVIDGIIKSEIDLEQKKAQDEIDRQQSLQFLEENRATTTSVTQASTQKFYFYNPQTLSFGFAEFQKKWGPRKLADNWRISSKESLEIGNEEEFSELEKEKNDSILKLKNDRKSRSYYLQNVPMTKEMMDTSNIKVAQALYNLGFIYKEKLLNYNKSIESFDKLLKRYPKGENTPAAYYFLFQIYVQNNNESDAKYYKKTLLNEYPNTDYAKILSDPEYYAKLQVKTEKAKSLYKDAYTFYNQGNYNKTLELSEEALKGNALEKVLLSKFSLLKALAIGKTSDTSNFVIALNIVISSYPETDAALLAAQIIEQMKKGNSINKSSSDQSSKSKQQEIEDKSIYSYNENETHIFVVVVDRNKIPATEVQMKLTNHNDTYFASDQLTVSAIPINNSLVIVGVSNFKNKTDAFTYYKTLNRNSIIADVLTKVDGNFFIISQENYTELYKSKDIDAYKKFYSKYYSE